MQGMQFGNRGFGGPPQPQRQGGRRGGNRGGGGGGPPGGFRNNSRFEHNQGNNQRNHNQGGQRPNDNQKFQQNKPPFQNQQNKPQQQNQSFQQNKPAQQQQAAKPQQQAQQQTQQNKPAAAATPAAQTPAPQQQKQDTPVPTPAQTPTQQAKPAQTTPAKQDTPKAQDKVDNASPAQKNQGQGNQQNQQDHQQPKNMNGNFGGNKGGWQGNRQRENSFGQGGNKFGQGGPGGQGGLGNNQGGGKFGQGGPQHNNQGGPQGNRQFGGPARNQQGNKRGPQDFQGGKPVQREEQMLANKLKDLVGPLTDLQTIEQPEVKFNGRSRLYIGNLSPDVTEEEITNMFKEFGECAELFLNKEKLFGFIKMDYRVNAERAKRELDGKNRKGKTLRVRFAPHNSAIRVKNLPPFVSNELLYRAFEIFGKIERAYVRVDERGKTLGEGVVEFARKPSALAAIRNCTEKCFFLTSSLRPVIVENFEEPDELDGYPEKNLPKKHPEFLRAREVGPRFSEAGSFEHEYGTRWKQLHELHKQKEDALKKELAAEEEKLEAQMEYAKYEHETELLREQLRQREQDRERQKRSWEMAERAADERRESERAALLRHEEELAARMRQQDDELRRRQQENTLFVQAQRLNSMLDRQEQGMFDQQQPMDGGFRDQYDMGAGNYEKQGGRGWDGPRMDDFPNKRRRF
ncbi:hypothetical protein O0L34_g11150 [Tuta absoluta]|nr:hypothetical protein O0L34_g11150 [Tuta absoluta]